MLDKRKKRSFRTGSGTTQVASGKCYIFGGYQQKNPKITLGVADGSASQVLGMKAWFPKFDLWNRHRGGRRGIIPQNCPLISTCGPHIINTH